MFDELRKSIEERNVSEEVASLMESMSEGGAIEDDILDDIMYKLSEEAIKDIRANEKKGVAYFKDLQTSTLIELAEIQ